MAVRIQFRRGTAAEWAAANPTLAAGELGYETDTGSMKIGTGTTAWSSLAYSAVSQSYIDDAIANVVGLSPEDLDTLQELATAVGNDPDFVTTITAAIGTSEANVMAYANSVATTAQSAAQGYTDNAIADLVASSPAALDTLNELAAALGDDPNFATTVSTSIGEKLSFVADTTATYETSSSHTEASTIYIATNAPGYVKMGDGVSTWSALTYVGGSLAAELISNHSNDTTDIHGIADTANLAYQADVAQVSVELSDLSNTVAIVSGVANTASSDVSTLQTTVGEHLADTTNVHGIANTADIVMTADLTDLSNTITSNIGTVQSALDIHSADTTNVHGITDTANLVYVADLAATYAPLSGPTFSGTVSLPSTTSIGGVSTDEISYLNGVTGAIQTQLDSKLESATAEVTYAPIANATLTGLVSLPQGTTIGTVSAEEIGSLDGVTSSIQAQLDAKAPVESPTFTGTVSGVSKGMVGLGNVDNTADADKPISTATQDALDLKADLSGATFSGNVVVTGDFTVTGTTTTVNTANFTTTDPLIYLGEGNEGNTADLGFVANFNDGTYQHTGLVRDSSAGTWKLFKGVTDEPTATVNFGQGSLDDLAVNSLSVSYDGVTFQDGTVQDTAGVPSITKFSTLTANYTLDSISKKDGVYEVNSSTPVTITIPTNANLAWPVGASVDFLQVGTGQVTISPASGVTLNYTPGNKLRTQWSSCTIMKRDTDSWILYGDLKA